MGNKSPVAGKEKAKENVIRRVNPTANWGLRARDLNVNAAKGSGACTTTRLLRSCIIIW